MSSDDGTTSDVTVVLLPGADDAPAGLTATLAAVRAEVGEAARIVCCPTVAGGIAWPGVEAVAPAEVAAANGLLGFARAGDRWRPGTWAARRRPLEAHPTAVIGVAGHVRTGGAGDGVIVAAPMPPVDLGTALLGPTIEAAAVTVRATALDPDAVELLHRPQGDALVWARLIAAHGHLPSGELAADVPYDPDRHGLDARARRDALHAEVTADDGDEDPPDRSALRRELLRRTVLAAPAGGADVDPGPWLGASATPRARAVVEDLRWALLRQSEALAAERVAWRPETLGDGGPVDGSLDLEQLRYEMRLAEARDEIAASHETVRWLDTEVAHREATIERLNDELRRHRAEIERLAGRATNEPRSAAPTATTSDVASGAEH